MKMSCRLAATLILLSCGTAYAGAPEWTISESSGRVVVLRGGVSQIAVRGGSLTAGDSVSTSGNSRAVLVRGGEYLVVSPNSRIKIANPITSGGFTQIIQDLGNTIFRIKKKTTPHFAVETPYLAAVVKGTTFSVTVTDAGTAVQVTEGLVQVSTVDGGATHLVRPGDIGLVDALMPLRLQIVGKEAQIIDSPNKPSATPAPSASVAASATTAFAEEATKDAAPAPSAFDSVIGTAVSEGPVRLDAVSGGLVSGNSTLLAAVDMVRPASQASQSDQPPVPVTETAPPPETVTAPSPAVSIPPADVAEASDTRPVPVPVATPITPVVAVVVAPVATVVEPSPAIIIPPTDIVIAPSPPVEIPPAVVVSASDTQVMPVIAPNPTTPPINVVAVVDIPSATGLVPSVIDIGNSGNATNPQSGNGRGNSANNNGNGPNPSANGGSSGGNSGNAANPQSGSGQGSSANNNGNAANPPAGSGSGRGNSGNATIPPANGGQGSSASNNGNATIPPANGGQGSSANNNGNGAPNPTNAPENSAPSPPAGTPTRPVLNMITGAIQALRNSNLPGRTR